MVARKAVVRIFAAFLLGAAALAQERRPPAARTPSAPEPIPEKFRELPHLAVSDFEKPPAQAPVLIRVRSGSTESCRSVLFASDRADSVTISPGQETKPATIVQLFQDRILGRSYLAVDGGSPELRGVLVLERTGNAEWSAPGGALEVSVSYAAARDAGGPCEPASTSAPAGTVHWNEANPRTNGDALLLRAEIRADQAPSPGVVWGWCVAEGPGGASNLSAIRNPGPSSQEWKLVTYITPDGRAAAAALAFTHVWRDPRDGRDYRFSQSGATDFLALPASGNAVLSLDAGPALPHSIDLTFVTEKEWAQCASRAAARGEATSR
jgi:hypothetical protein